MNFLIQITWLPILGPLYLAQQIDCTSYDLSSKGFKPCTLDEVDYQDSYLYWTVCLSTSVENEQLLFWKVECFLSMQNCDNLVHVCSPNSTYRVSFDLETGAVGQTTDFKEANKVLEWCCRKVCPYLGSWNCNSQEIRMLGLALCPWTEIHSEALLSPHPMLSRCRLHGWATFSF